MIGKLWRGTSWLLVQVCVATIIAQAILMAYCGRAWQLNRVKLIQMLAIAQGVDLAALREQAGGSQELPPQEQASYNQVLETRAVKSRNLELREQALRSGLQQVQSEQDKFAEAKRQFLATQEKFGRELAALEKGAAATGREDARRTLEAMKPKQAKELLVQMLERKEMDEAVVLLAGMTESRRAKIAAEFKSPNEVEQLGELLRRIRQGTPLAGMAESTEKQMGQ
jgi:hypothetical protein